MLSLNDIAVVLTAHGFESQVQTNKKVVRFQHLTLQDAVYLKPNKGERDKHYLVLHSRYEPQLRTWSIDGLAIGTHYFSSALGGFEKRINRGQKPEAFGIDLGLLQVKALEALIDRLLDAPPSPVAPPTAPYPDRSPLATDNVAHTETERDALIKVRIGQGGYRQALIDYWAGCAVTGHDNPTMLRASHAKPWRYATNDERIDPFNGLLLTPNLDLAFDQGLVTFAEDGQLLISSRMDAPSAALLGINPNMALLKLDARHQPYLAWHRELVFKP